MLRLWPLSSAVVFLCVLAGLSWTAVRLNTFDSTIDVGQPIHSHSTSPVKLSESRLHLLIVATNSGLNLCRLLLSASVLSYPSPVLIDWAGEGEFDAAKTHLAKVAGPLRYLESLDSAQDSDIVVLLDGFDVTLQLGPDVLLKRYFEERANALSRLNKRFGTKHVKKHNMYNSILFGPDKVCWPDNFRRAACWAVPPSPLLSDAFGPDTDRWMGDMPHARPRWLNSGTIIGPAAELRTLFRATERKINETWNRANGLRNSDQLYFSDVWADQEYERSLSQGWFARVPMPRDVEQSDIPTLEQGRSYELHIGLDYSSSLFQTVAGYSDYLEWMRLSQSQLRSTKPAMEINQDLLLARKPFATFKEHDTLGNTSWEDLTLGINTVTGVAFPVLHFTGDKSLRDEWWRRMWYVKHAERLQCASTKTHEETIGNGTISDVRWLKRGPFAAAKYEDKSGAWSDQGEMLGWAYLCGAHEDALYRGP
jgi:hypothetical protein